MRFERLAGCRISGDGDQECQREHGERDVPAHEVQCLTW